jgi:hypothetical protein
MNRILSTEKAPVLLSALGNSSGNIRQYLTILYGQNSAYL